MTVLNELDQLRKDMVLLSQQQQEVVAKVKAIKAPAPPRTGFTERQIDLLGKMMKEAFVQLEKRLTDSHVSVHRSAIAEVKGQAMAVTMLGKANFTEACDALKQSIEQVLAGTGAKAS
ncbi:hypothetical protein QTH91_05865 [Variovorax dokdonensis]|uniref:Uncharacterized protein n=1 Tax=Variovorax dokdonensis TaxID=344883 RepID=A0ABT7N7Z1_9BURK|nr:hypothetical protein [Variovorax dokdonensis]MDM0044000.1 hypothetical protein [Variovorax dokdonensis]